MQNYKIISKYDSQIFLYGLRYHTEMTIKNIVVFESAILINCSDEEMTNNIGQRHLIVKIADSKFLCCSGVSASEIKNIVQTDGVRTTVFNKEVGTYCNIIDDSIEKLKSNNTLPISIPIYAIVRGILKRLINKSQDVQKTVTKFDPKRFADGFKEIHGISDDKNFISIVSQIARKAFEFFSHRFRLTENFPQINFEKNVLKN